MENSINNQENQPQPPIDTVPTPLVLDGTPKKKNYLPWLLGILVLIGISTTFFLILTGKSKSIPSGSLTQGSPAEISESKVTSTTPLQNNWKTYQSDIYNFSFSYPTDWEISEIGGYGRQPGEYDSLLLKAPYTQQELVERKNINLTEEKNYVFMTIHDFPKTAYIPKTNEFEKVSQKEILIDSLSATEYQIEVTENPQPPVESPYPAGTSYTVIYIVHNDGYLVLEHVDKDKPEIFQQILSTFKFTERNGEAAFILYESKKFGVSFKYDSRLDIAETENDIVIDSSHYLIKVFKKNPNDTLEEAINKILLANYNRSDCFAILSKVNPTHPDFISAEVSYPLDKNPQNESNLPNCDSTYYKTNGARVFWMDPSHPDKFIFIEGGQSVIYSSGDIDWPSFKFLD